jgi:transposase
MSKRVFSEAYKSTAVSMVLEEGKSQAEVSRHLSIGTSTLSKWLKEHKTESNSPVSEQGLSARVKELESENRTLRMEREFLKKAAIFFVKEEG